MFSHFNQAIHPTTCQGSCQFALICAETGISLRLPLLLSEEPRRSPLSKGEHDGGHRGGEEEEQRDGVRAQRRPETVPQWNPLVVHAVRSILRSSRDRYAIGDVQEPPAVSPTPWSMAVIQHTYPWAGTMSRDLVDCPRSGLRPTLSTTNRAPVNRSSPDVLQFPPLTPNHGPWTTDRFSPNGFNEPKELRLSPLPPDLGPWTLNPL